MRSGRRLLGGCVRISRIRIETIVYSLSSITVTDLSCAVRAAQSIGRNPLWKVGDDNPTPKSLRYELIAITNETKISSTYNN